MDQVRREVSLERSDLSSERYHLSQVAAPRCRAERKTVDGNAAIRILHWQIRVVLSRHDNKLMAITQGEKKLRGKNLAASDIRPKQIRPE
jgi:hypothetical protein